MVDGAVNNVPSRSVDHGGNVITRKSLVSLKGMGDGTFAPKAELTRAQAAVIIQRMINEQK